MEGKKAQGLSITTIILIILGVIVLVMLIVGFTMGWSGIKDWIAPSNNVQQIVSQCEIACATGGKYDFCSELRTLKIKGDDIEDTNCYALATNSDYAKYGIDECKAITCDSSGEGTKTCNSIGGDWIEGDCPTSKPDVYTGGDLSDAGDNAGKNCCYKFEE